MKKAVLICGVFVMIAMAAYAVSSYYEADGHPTTVSSSYATLSQRGLYFPNGTGTNCGNTIRMYDETDTINMGQGDDILHMSGGADAIIFHYWMTGDPTQTDDNTRAFITFDKRGGGCISGCSDPVTNSHECIVSTKPNNKTESQIKVESHQLALTTHGGDVVVTLGSELTVD